jgi:hypothetical protein
MATKKKPVIGPVTRAKVTGVVRKVQNSKAAGVVKKAGAAIKQEARVVGRAVTGYSAKKEKANESSSSASAFQAPKSRVFGSGPIKSPAKLREERKEARIDKREERQSARKADRVKKGVESNRSFTTSYPSSERFQSSKEGLTFKGIPLSNRKRKAVRTINENLNTKLEGRERKKLAKEYYKDIKSKPQRVENIDADLNQIKAFITTHLS